MTPDTTAIRLDEFSQDSSLDYAEFPHTLHRFYRSDGSVVLLGHGTPDGYFVWQGFDGDWRVLPEDSRPEGLLVCCYPSRVAARYPRWDVYLPEWDADVSVTYGRDADGNGILTVSV